MSVLDETPQLIVSQQLLHQLLARDDLLTPQQHLQMYDSPLNISLDIGRRHLSDNLSFIINMFTQKENQLSYQT